MASMRDQGLPTRCKAWSTTECARECFIVANDEEVWRLHPWIFGSVGPSNTQGWRVCRPGRQARWEGVMVRMEGEMGRLSAGRRELRGRKEGCITDALLQVGRRRGQPTDAGPRWNALARGPSADHTNHLIWVIAFDGLSGTSAFRLEVCTDCDSIVRWVNGTQTLFSPSFLVPLTKATDMVSTLRSLGCRLRGMAHDWVR